MDSYKKPYFLLFNAITDALKQLETAQPLCAAATLIEAQKNAEELVISEEE